MGRRNRVRQKEQREEQAQGTEVGKRNRVRQKEQREEQAQGRK